MNSICKMSRRSKTQLSSSTDNDKRFLTSIESFLDPDSSSIDELFSREKNLNNIPSTQSCAYKVSKAPISCPIRNCGRIMGVREVLSHFLNYHKQKDTFEIQPIKANKKCILVFDYDVFKDVGENICLGILAYEGVADLKPAASGICMSSVSLPKKYAGLSDDLPILIMGCKTHASVLISDIDKASRLSKISEINEDTENIIFIWLASTPTTKPLYATLNAKNKDFSISRGTNVTIRPFTKQQIIEDLARNSPDYLLLNYGSCKKLTYNFQEPIELEIILFEYDA